MPTDEVRTQHWTKPMKQQAFGQAFDLNDIFHEPSDEQLDALMESVAAEARKHAKVAHEQLMGRLRADIAEINSHSYPHDR